MRARAPQIHGYRTLTEVGNILGLTKERIRQIEGEAIQHLAEKLDVSRIDALVGLISCMMEDHPYWDGTEDPPSVPDEAWDRYRGIHMADRRALP